MKSSEVANVYTENTQGYVVKFNEFANRVEYENYYTHKHDYWEFFLVTKGETYHFLNHSRSIIKKRDLTLIKPDDYHCMKFIEPAPYQHLDLYATPHIFQTICDLMDPNLYSFFLETDIAMTIHLSEKECQQLQEMIDELYLMQNSLQGSSLIYTYYYPCLTKVISLFAQQFYFNNNSKESTQFFSFLSKINTPQHISDSVEEIVALSNYSQRQLGRLFKKHTNKTIKQYLTITKMNYSIELLRNEELSILTISEMIGYDSVSHYITTFKKHTGFTPQKYRSMLIHGNFFNNEKQGTT